MARAAGEQTRVRTDSSVALRATDKLFWGHKPDVKLASVAASPGYLSVWVRATNNNDVISYFMANVLIGTKSKREAQDRWLGYQARALGLLDAGLTTAQRNVQKRKWNEWLAEFNAEAQARLGPDRAPVLQMFDLTDDAGAGAAAAPPQRRPSKRETPEQRRRRIRKEEEEEEERLRLIIAKAREEEAARQRRRRRRREEEEEEEEEEEAGAAYTPSRREPQRRRQGLTVDEMVARAKAAKAAREAAGQL